MVPTALHASKKWPPSRPLRSNNRLGFLASDGDIRKCFALASMPAFPLSTNTPFHCADPRFVNMPPGGAGPSPCKCRRLVPALRNGNCGKSWLDAARRREIDVVLVWRLDRWGRPVTDLLTWRIAGSSASPLPNWRWMETDLISDAQLLDRTFPGGRPSPSGKHHKWDQLFLRVKRASKNPK